MNSLFELCMIAFISENIILNNVFGIEPFLETTKNKNDTLKLSFIFMIMLFFTSILSYLSYTYIIKKFNLEYLRIMIFTIVVIIILAIILIIIKYLFSPFYIKFLLYFLFVVVNSAVFGHIQKIIYYSFLDMFFYTIFSGLGFLFVSIIFSALKEKIDNSPVPKGFKGLPITLIAAGAMALIFYRLSGIF